MNQNGIAIVLGLALALAGCASQAPERAVSATPEGTADAGGSARKESGTRNEAPGSRTDAPGDAATQDALAARAALVSPAFVEVWLDTRERPLGAYTLTLRYDPAVVIVQDVGTGDLSKFPDLPRTNPATYTSGATTLAGFQTAGLSPTGRTRIATIFFASAGPGLSALSATIETLVDPQGNPIPGEVLLSADRVEAMR